MVLLDAAGHRALVGGVRALPRGAPPGRPGRLLRRRRPVRDGARAPRPPALARPDDAAAPARARRPARAALPRPQDPGGRAVPSLTCPWDPWKSFATPSRRRRPSCATASPALAVRPTLERPKKAGFGDYSSNAAMLLAPALGAPPREIAERLAGTLSGALGERVDHVEVAGPGFLNVFLAEGWFAAALEELLAAGEALRRRRARAAREGAGRVRLRQPDGAADRRQRPPRRLRRRAGADPRARRPRRQPRVLLQRLGLPGRPPRPVDPRARAGRGAAGGRLPGRLRRRARARHRGRRRARDRRARAPRRRRDHDRHPGDARGLPRRRSTRGSWSAASTTASRAPSSA